MIKVHDNAKSKLENLLAEGNYGEGAFVRVSVKGGGCSGLMYNLDFDTKMGEDDKVFEDKGIKIVVDQESLPYLTGSKIDFITNGLDRTFQFNNPNATDECGCGESFTIS